MKVNPNIMKLVEGALTGLDNIGYQLDNYGVTSQFNRHTVIAYAMAEQKHLEGELDSLKARIGSQKVRIENTVNKVEGFIENGVNLALTPARQTIKTVKNFIG